MLSDQNIFSTHLLFSYICCSNIQLSIVKYLLPPIVSQTYCWLKPKKREKQNHNAYILIGGCRQSKIVYLRIAWPSENWSLKRCCVWHLQSLPRLFNFFIIIIFACVRLSVQCSSLQSLYFHKNMQNIYIISHLLKIITGTIHELHKHNSECSTFQIISTEKERFKGFKKGLIRKRRRRMPRARFHSKSKVAEPAWLWNILKYEREKGLRSIFGGLATNGNAGYNS